MTIDSSQIIIIDAIIITGLLILITIGTSVEETPNYNRFTAISTLMILPFAISAIQELRKSYKETNSLNYKTGAGWMFFGFIFLVLIISIMFVIEFFKLNLFG